jgi:DNA repair photolyase
MARLSGKYKGPLRIVEKEMKPLGEGKRIFVCSNNDLFCAENLDIRIILRNCQQYQNEYIFQTKNPTKAFEYRADFPKNSTIGTTIETNRPMGLISKAPQPLERLSGIKEFKHAGFKTFITIEPILDFDTSAFVDIITCANPDFINIGADSKHSGLPEPSPEKIIDLLDELKICGVTIRKKSNLERLMAS